MGISILADIQVSMVDHTRHLLDLRICQGQLVDYDRHLEVDSGFAHHFWHRHDVSTESVVA